MSRGNDYLPSALRSRGKWNLRKLDTYFEMRAQPRWRDRALVVHDSHRHLTAFDAEFLLHYVANSDASGGKEPCGQRSCGVNVLQRSTQRGVRDMPPELQPARLLDGATDPRLCALDRWLEQTGASELERGAVVQEAFERYEVCNCSETCCRLD